MASNFTFPSNNLTFPDRPECFQINGSSILDPTCGPVTTTMLDFLNITDPAKYFQAYCLDPPQDSCAFGFCPNPDIAGPAVRYSTYITNICLALVILYSPSEASDTFFAQVLTIYSLIVSAIIAIALQQLTRVHAMFALIAASSPLTLYLIYHATMSAFSRPNRLSSLFGEGKWLNRTIILLAVPLWLAVTIFMTVPHSDWRFQQEACDAEGFNHFIADFLLGPLGVLVVLSDSRPGLFILFILLVAPLLAWGVAIWLRRDEIWDGTKRFPWGRMWSVVMKHYPFIQFCIVIWIPHLYWLCSLEVSEVFDQEPFEASYGQLLAIFVAVPPVLSVLRLLPRLGMWFIDLTWVRLLTSRPRPSHRTRTHHRMSSRAVLAETYDIEQWTDPYVVTLEPTKVREDSDGETAYGAVPKHESGAQ